MRGSWGAHRKLQHTSDEKRSHSPRLFSSWTSLEQERERPSARAAAAPALLGAPQVSLWNTGENAYQPEALGRRFTVERRIKRFGGSSVAVITAAGKKVRGRARERPQTGCCLCGLEPACAESGAPRRASAVATPKPRCSGLKLAQ